jgi:hypothetical protein
MVKFGNRSYELPALSIRKSAAIRARFQDIFSGLDTILNASSVEISNQEGLSKLFDALLDIVRNVVLKSPDLALDIVCGYAPAIQTDREWIIDNATDEDVLTAFVEVVKRLYPFGSLTNLVSGLVKQATSMSSASRSGGDGSMK